MKNVFNGEPTLIEICAWYMIDRWLDIVIGGVIDIRMYSDRKNMIKIYDR